MQMKTWSNNFPNRFFFTIFASDYEVAADLSCSRLFLHSYYSFGYDHIHSITVKIRQTK